jgi:hypothetical protein
MDYLPIQATSVPCERVFSSAKETDTAKRNKINPVLMETLQMLKFSLKKKRLDFMAGWVTSESELTNVEPVHLGSLVGDDGELALDGVLNHLGEHDEVQ